MASKAPEKALPYFEQVLEVRRRLTDREIAFASEADALAVAAAVPLTRDAFLTAARHLPGSDAAAYRHIWASKAAVTRVLERRHAAAPRCRAPSIKRSWPGCAITVDGPSVWCRIRGSQPRNATSKLADLADERDRLERELATRAAVAGAVEGARRPRSRRSAQAAAAWRRFRRSDGLHPL